MHFYAFYASTRPLPDRFVIYKVKRTREKNLDQLIKVGGGRLVNPYVKYWFFWRLSLLEAE